MKKRCDWCGNDPQYQQYHDEEWGVPGDEDLRQFEFLILESAQAGLNWLTILRKREGYRKALRLMKLANKFGLPIITIIDTAGAFPGIGAEERHIAEAIAVNLKEMMTLEVPIIAVVIGEGGSGGALGIGVADRVLILENAYYSVISPEGCAAILWKDRAAAPDAAEALKITSDHLKKFGLVDEIIPEPLGGAHNDPGQTAETLKAQLLKHLKALKKMPLNKLQAQRYEKFRAHGKFEEQNLTKAAN